MLIYHLIVRIFTKVYTLSIKKVDKLLTRYYSLFRHIDNIVKTVFAHISYIS